jgi:hypothetical protein
MTSPTRQRATLHVLAPSMSAAVKWAPTVGLTRDMWLFVLNADTLAVLGPRDHLVLAPDWDQRPGNLALRNLAVQKGLPVLTTEAEIVQWRMDQRGPAFEGRHNPVLDRPALAGGFRVLKPAAKTTTRPRRTPGPRVTAPKAAPQLSSEGLPLARCEFCGEPIVWAETHPNPNARTAKGQEPKLVPIDPEPTTDPRARLAVTTKEGWPRPRVGEMTYNAMRGYLDRGGKIYIQHVKTCTKADDMRRGIVNRHTKRK